MPMTRRDQGLAGWLSRYSTSSIQDDGDRRVDSADDGVFDGSGETGIGEVGQMEGWGEVDEG